MKVKVWSSFVGSGHISTIHCHNPGAENTPPEDGTPANSGDELASEIERAGWRKTAPPPLSDELQDLSQSQGPLDLADSDLMCGLLEVMAVLWEVAKDRLDKPTHQKVRKKLWNKMAKSLPLFFDTFTVSPSILSSSFPIPVTPSFPPPSLLLTSLTACHASFSGHLIPFCPLPASCSPPS